jgi:hypothetical protein
MPAAAPLICFTSKRFEIHPCPNCRYPMTLISGNSSHPNSDTHNFHCFNCASVDSNSLTRLGPAGSV